MLPLNISTVVIQLPQFIYYAALYTVQVQSEFKIKIIDKNQIYGEDLRCKTQTQKFGTTMYFSEGLKNMYS